MDTKKVPVSKRAVIARINRALAKENQTLRVSRSNAERSNFGEAFILDTMHNTVVAHQISINDLAVEIGALKAFEEMTEE